MDSSIALPDYIIIAGFFAVMMAIGLYYANRMKDLGDFFSGGRQVPWVVSGISLYMTTFSAFTFVAYSALAYTHGFVAITIWWLSVPCCFLTARLLAGRWRRAATTSPLEYIGTRFGPGLRQGFAWIGLPLIVVDDALKLFVIGKMVTVSLGITHPQGLPIAIAVCGVIILGYTFLGGLWAVLITDVIQFVVVAVAVAVLIPLALHRVGGFGSFLEQTPGGFWRPVAGDYTWPWVLAFGAVLLLTYAAKWPYVQRYYAVGSDAEARKVGYLVGVLMFAGPPLLFFPAMAARVFMPGIPDANDVYPLLCRELLPVGMTGIVIAAMFSATMSMLSSDYNAGASVITSDIVKPLLGKGVSERKLVWVARWSTFLIGILALGIALILARAANLEDLVKYMARLFGTLMPPVAIPMAAGLLSHRASNRGAILGFLLGTAFGIGAFFLSQQPALAYLGTVTWITWITILPTTFGMVLGTLLLPDGEDRKRAVAEFLEGLTATRSGGKAAWNEGGDALVAIRIICVASAALGLLMLLSIVFTGNVSGGRLTLGVGAGLAIAGTLAALFAGRLASRGSGD